jgi:hypothetical protein
MTLDVYNYWDGQIAFRLPYKENVQHIRRTLEAKLGAKPIEQYSALIGAKHWIWAFDATRSLILVHFQKGRGRSNPCNVIRLVDTGTYTGHFGSAN